MARCPGCNKFAGLEMQEPEVESVNVERTDCGNSDPTVTVTASVRIVRTSSCCGDEMKSADLELEGECTIADGHEGEGHDLEAEEEGCDSIDGEGDGKGRPSRYSKTFYGASVEVAIMCTCGDEPVEVGRVTLSDRIAASAMEDLTE